MALMTLNEKIDCEELMFWGMINGMKNDYYIAMAMVYTNMYEFPVKTFYWALSNEFVFKEMPQITTQHDSIIDADVAYFMGEPEKLLGKKEGDGDDDDNDDAKK